jgi:hypothetical protein
MRHTWKFLLILGGISHCAVHWLLISSAVQALIHDLDVIVDHQGILCAPYKPVPPEINDGISEGANIVT